MKTKFLILFAMAIGMVSCENQENQFDDFGSTTVYFPFQTPARGLILGDYDLGYNENDNNGRFEVGVTMTGVYTNDINRKVYFEVDPSIIDPTELGATDVNVKVLPEAYYTIEQESPVTIPSGSIKGRIPVKLTEAFFDDPLAVAGLDSVNYVLPLRITDIGGELDSLFTGVPNEGITDPKRVIAEDWLTLPKDYTLYGIKFFNKYHGTHLRRGEDKILGTSTVEKVYTNGSPTETETSNVDDTTIYHNEYVEGDEVTLVSTVSKNQVANTNLVRRGALPSSSKIALLLTIDDNEDIVVSNADPNSAFVVTGTGKYVENGDEWGGEKRHVIYLAYQYNDVAQTVEEERFFGSLISTTTTTVDLDHTVNDTLVLRDRDIKFEEFTVEVTP